jgi:hypothetical protein
MQERNCQLADLRDCADLNAPDMRLYRLSSGQNFALGDHATLAQSLPQQLAASSPRR